MDGFVVFPASCHGQIDCVGPNQLINFFLRWSPISVTRLQDNKIQLLS